MTDLISNLAQQIVGLINSQVRSPTQAEIEEVLKPAFEVGRKLPVPMSPTFREIVARNMPRGCDVLCPVCQTKWAFDDHDNCPMCQPRKGTNDGAAR